MRKFKSAMLVVLSILLIVSCGAFFACSKTPEPEKLQPAADDFSYYPQLPQAKDKKLYVISGSALSEAEMVSVSCLQGLVARTSAEIYIETDDDQGDLSNFKLWLSDLVENYGFTYERINTAAELITKYADYITDKGIVVYTAATNVSEDSLNVATTVCAAEGYLPVEESLIGTAQSVWGLGDIKVDTRETTEDGDYRDQRWAFETYKDKLNRSILFHQDPQKNTLRDYAVATKGLCFFDDGLDIRLIVDIYEWAEKDIPIIGWCQDELAYVALNSGFSKITIGADWSTNLSTFSSVKMPEQIRQKNYTARTITPDPNKHYLALVMSDGDNIQWMQTNLYYRSEWYGSSFRGDFKMTWGANPSASDLIPTILQKVYDAATPNDEFITGVSGNGYINPTQYESLNDYVSRTNAYMKRADLKYVDLLDGGVDPDAIQPYGQMPQIGGGVWKVGDHYVEGGGGVYWANDKPFITFRESLWGETAESMLALANRINHYQTDPSRIEGYTVLNIHPWTHSMTDVKKFVGMLDEHVEIITAGELIEMVKANVPHEDVVELEKADIPPVVVPDYVLPGVTKEDLGLLTPLNGTVFKTADIASQFSKMGKYSQHPEGMCLEVQTPAATLQSFFYAKINVTEANDKLIVSARRFVRPGEKDAMLGVSVVDPDGNVRVIRAEGAESDWYTIDTDPYKEPEYDLSAYRGKTVTVAIGSKQGEHMAINEVRFVRGSDNFVLPTVSLDALNAHAVASEYSFTTDTILNSWTGVGTKGGEIAVHGEGVCLQFAGQNRPVDTDITTFLYNRFTIDDAHKTLTVSARTFAGQNAPDATVEQYIPMLTVKVIEEDGTTHVFDLVAIDSDNYIVSNFDLSAYAGRTVGIAIGVGRGYHCAINSIVLA